MHLNHGYCYLNVINHKIHKCVIVQDGHCKSWCGSQFLEGFPQNGNDLSFM